MLCNELKPVCVRSDGSDATRQSRFCCHPVLLRCVFTERKQNRISLVRASSGAGAASPPVRPPPSSAPHTGPPPSCNPPPRHPGKCQQLRHIKYFHSPTPSFRRHSCNMSRRASFFARTHPGQRRVRFPDEACQLGYLNHFCLHY